MTVTKDRAVDRKNAEVYLDGEFAFVLYKGELSRFGIRRRRRAAGGTTGEDLKRKYSESVQNCGLCIFWKIWTSTEAELRETV